MDERAATQCNYVLKSGAHCPHPASPQGLCFWHDPTQPKDQPHHVQALEALARGGHSLEGFALKGAKLEGINLVNNGEHQGFDLRHIDLYRADLRGAHLFMADLRGASLMKANLSEANLHFANLTDANLLGIKLKNARIENVIWGQRLLQENRARQANREKNARLAQDYYEQSEEICRNIRNVAAHQGLVDMAGHFFHKEMTMRRKQQPRLSSRRLLSKFVDLTCGYGERPVNVMSFSVAVIVLSALVYYLLGIAENGELIRAGKPSPEGWLHDVMTCLYYSVVTFTTLGYGEIVPLGFSRVFAALEAFTGSFTLALFVVVFVKKMTR